MKSVIVVYDNETYSNTLELKCFMHFIGVACHEVNESVTTVINSNTDVARADAILYFNKPRKNSEMSINCNDNLSLEKIAISMRDRNIITCDEYEDICFCITTFRKYEYTKAFYCLYFNQKQENNSIVNKYYTVYKNILNELGNADSAYNGYHKIYATLLIAYEMEIIGKRYNMQAYVDADSIIDIACKTAMKDISVSAKCLAADTSLNILENTEKAFKLFIDAQNLDRYNSKTHFGLGEIYFKKLEYKSAITYFGECILLDADNYMALYRLGHCYNKLNNNVESVEAFKKVVNVLSNKCDIQLLNNIESEYMFASLMMLAQLESDIRSVNKYCVLALKLVKNTTKLYGTIEIDRVDSEEFHKNLVRVYDIKKLKKYGIESSSRLGLLDQAREFYDLQEN